MPNVSFSGHLHLESPLNSILDPALGNWELFVENIRFLSPFLLLFLVDVLVLCLLDYSAELERSGR